MEFWPLKSKVASNHRFGESWHPNYWHRLNLKIGYTYVSSHQILKLFLIHIFMFDLIFFYKNIIHTSINILIWLYHSLKSNDPKLLIHLKCTKYNNVAPSHKPQLYFHMNCRFMFHCELPIGHGKPLQLANLLSIYTYSILHQLSV